MARVECEKCGAMTKNIHFHKCEGSMPANDVADAWLGDAIHIFLVRLFLLRSGRSSSDTDVLVSYISAEGQARYMVEQKLVPLITRDDGSVGSSLSVRQMSTSFEARFFRETVFRDNYIREKFSFVSAIELLSISLFIAFFYRFLGPRAREIQYDF